MYFRSFLLAATVSAVFATAQEAPRFAFFHPGYLVENTAQGKRVFAEVQTLGKRLSDSLKAKAEELQKMEQQLRTPSISEEGRGKISRELEDGRIAFQRMQEDSQAQMQRAEQTAFQQFQGEIGPIIEALAKEQNLHCVFQLQEGMLAWVDQAWALKFTEEIAKRYDAAYSGGSAAKAK